MKFRYKSEQYCGKLVCRKMWTISERYLRKPKYTLFINQKTVKVLVKALLRYQS